MYLNGQKEELIANYLNKVLEKASINKDTTLVNVILEKFKAGYKEQGKKEKKLRDTLWEEGAKSIVEVFEGTRYEKLEVLFGEKNAKIFKSIWDNASKYTYSIGYYRRSYRTKKSSWLYLTKNIEKLIEFLYLKVLDFSLEKYFENNKEEYRGISVISDIIAFEIDNHNENVLDNVRGLIYNDNNTSILTREVIKGLLMSENEEAHKMIGELLLAAKLQEGLRQAIVETLDEGSKKACIYILKIIMDNNLIRFSSVVRGFCVWTGLALEAEKPKLISKCFETVYKALTDEEYKSFCLASDDNILLYTGIWAVAFDEIEDVDDILNKLLHGNVKYKKLVALQFLVQIQFSEYRHKMACEMLEDEDLEVIGLSLKNLFASMNPYSLINNENLVKSYANLGENYYGTGLFNKLKKILDNMPKKDIEFNESVFPWVSFELTKAEVMDNMLLAVGMSFNEEIVDILIDYKDKMAVMAREVFVKKFLENPKNIKQKKALIEACGDRGQTVRSKAFKVIDSLELTKEDYDIIENLLKYKSGDLRKSAIKLLLKQSGDELLNTINNLTSSKDENKKLAAIDIVNAMEGDSKHKDIFDKGLKSISLMGDVLQKGKILTESITRDAKEVKNSKNGFGLYEPSKSYVPSKLESKNFDIKNKFSLGENEIIEIINKFSNLIDENRDLEYEIINWDDSKTSVVLGTSYYLRPFNRNGQTLDNYPLAEEIRRLTEDSKLKGWKLIELDFYIKAVDARRYAHYSEWYEEFLETNFNYKVIKNLSKTLEKIKYFGLIKAYITLLVNEMTKEERFEIGKAVAECVYTIVPKEKHTEKYLKEKDGYYYGGRNQNYFSSASEINCWLSLLRINIEPDERFKEYFNIVYNYYKASGYEVRATLDIGDFGHALELEIIDENEVLKEIMERPHSNENIRVLTSSHRYKREKIEKYKKLTDIAGKAVEVIGEIEVNRGELDTEVTHLAAKIEKCYGVNIFASIILASEKDTYIRGYNFVSGDCTKKQMLSHLLKCCYPKEGDNSETLKEVLKGKKVTGKQLVEAAMYSPQWLDIITEYLGYEGLKSACWYFHAHVNDYFSDKKTAIVARYTPIAMQDLKDGAFDQDWFKEAYKTLGEKNLRLFMIVQNILQEGLYIRGLSFLQMQL